MFMPPNLGFDQGPPHPAAAAAAMFPPSLPAGGEGGPPPDRFAIRWKGFQHNMSTAVADLLQFQSFSDLVIAAEDGTKINCHRIVVASGSHYFRDLLTDASSCQTPVIILPEVSGRVLKGVIEYLYLGQVNVDHDILDEFFKTARNLSLKGMTEEEAVHAPGLSLLSQTASIFPPHLPTYNNGLSILAQAAQAKEATKPFRVYPENTPKRFFDLENDENSPLNFASGAINLSTKDNLEPPLLSIPDYKYQLSPPSPTAALDMSTSATNQAPHSPLSSVSSNPGFDNGSPLPLYPLPDHHNLAETDPKKGKKKRKVKAKKGEGEEDAEEEEQIATPDKNWKSRQPRGCEICERTFSNKFNLKQHILNMHTPGRTVVCDLCDKKVKNKWYLRRHKVTHHNAPLKK